MDQGMKMVIYEKVDRGPRVKPRLEARRQITVHPTFIGIGEYGEPNMSEFRKLAHSLEPRLKEIEITVLAL